MDQQVTLVYIQGMIHGFKLFLRQEIIGLSLRNKRRCFRYFPLWHTFYNFERVVFYSKTSLCDTG